MKPSAVSRALRALVILEKQPVFIWGSPGTGKSAVLHQLAAELRGVSLILPELRWAVLAFSSSSITTTEQGPGVSG